MLSFIRELFDHQSMTHFWLQRLRSPAQEHFVCQDFFRYMDSVGPKLRKQKAAGDHFLDEGNHPTIKGKNNCNIGPMRWFLASPLGEQPSASLKAHQELHRLLKGKREGDFKSVEVQFPILD